MSFFCEKDNCFNMRLEKFCYCLSHNICEQCEKEPLEFEHYCASHPSCMEENCFQRREKCSNMMYFPQYCKDHKRCYLNGCNTFIGSNEYTSLCEVHETISSNQQGSPGFNSFLYENGYSPCEVECCCYTQTEDTSFCHSHYLCKEPKCYEKLSKPGKYCDNHDKIVVEDDESFLKMDFSLKNFENGL